MDNRSKLFCRQGYISLAEYLEDIKRMDREGPWRLPLRLSDRIQYGLLNLFSRVSWFNQSLYLIHPSGASPAYAIIIAYLKKRGFIESIGERESYIDGCFSYVATKKVSTKARSGTMTGQGSAEDRSVALSKALGEMIERMVTGVYDNNPLAMIESPSVVLRENLAAVYPPRFHRYLKIQKEKYHEVRHDPDIPIEWVAGRNLITHKRTLIPKKLTSWYVANGKRENMLAQATTNGSAGYFTKTGAILRGLLEIVQRDGLLVHWLTMTPPRVIETESLPENLLKLTRKFEEIGISIHVLDVTSLSIPAVIVAAVNERSPRGPQVVLSGSAALTFGEAIGAALRELVNGLEMFHYPESGSPSGMERNEPEAFLSKFGKIERQLYWRGAERVDRFRWFISGPRARYEEVSRLDLLPAQSRDSDRLAKCLEILKDYGHDYYPIAYFPKHRIQRDLGFHVAQVFIPKAFPLYLTEYLATFDSDRLEEFARARGVSRWNLNPYPHMFS